MKLNFILTVIFIISLILAIRDAYKEKVILDTVKKLKIKKKKTIAGVILFMKKRISHYSSDSS